MSIHPSFRSSVSPRLLSVARYRSCKQDILKTNELTLMPIGTSGLRGNIGSQEIHWAVITCNVLGVYRVKWMLLERQACMVTYCVND